MKKNFILVTVILQILFIQSVKALNTDVTCTYTNIDDSNENYGFIIYADNINPSEFSINGFSRVMYGNNNSKINLPDGSAGTFFTDKELDTVQEYYKNVGGCPDYFYIANSFGDTFAGYFSNIPFENLDKYLKNNVISNKKFKLTDDSKVKRDDDGSIVPVADKKSYLLHASKINKDFIVNINYTNKKIYFSNLYMEDEIITKYEKEYNYGNAQPPNDLYVCYNSYSDSLQRQYYVYPENKYLNRNFGDTCEKLEYKNGNVDVGSDGCFVYINMFSLYKSAIENGNLTDSKIYKDKLKNFCKNSLTYQNYTEYEFSCVQLCLNLKNDIKDNFTSDSNCGFSKRLLAWISNILKWIKYILPVVVIILSILDFIKAIAADKDDEMKKAQSKFIKRLIAAALVFIVPLILEFILEKMGFGYNSCDLF